MRRRRCVGEQRRHQHDRACGRNDGGSVATSDERQLARPVSAVQVSGRPDVAAAQWQYRQCRIGGGPRRDQPPHSAYCASKHGLIGLTRALAAEWGGRGVRVNAVCPSWIKTEMDTADQGSGAYSDQDIVNRAPMARFAQPQDVAAAIAFLTDAEKSGFVNGIALPVDGGWIADASWESLRIRTRA